MKRIIVAFVLLVFVGISIFVGIKITHTQCDIISKDIEEITKNINDNDLDNAINNIEKIKNEWLDRKSLLSVFSNHSPIDEITVVINELDTAVKTKDKSQSLIKCAKINALIGRISEEQRINIESFY